jgi:hypothetical protein
MDYLHFNKIFISFVVLCALMCIMQPVLAQNGTMTIAYRGSGGYYLGDTVIFDGKDTVGNTPLLKITGPNLPPSGVPVYNLDGAPGSGNTISLNPDGSWKFVWSTARIAGIEKMVTARYTVTAFDLSDTRQTASVSVFLKKPEFYINIEPSTVMTGEYIQLNGVAEKGVTNVKIDISDSNGKILNTYTVPVSADGFFSYGFRGKIQPGQYFVSAGNPAMKNTLRSTITVVASSGLTPESTTPLPQVTLSENLTAVPSPSPVISRNVTPLPSAVPLSPFTVIAGLIFSGILLLTTSTRSHKP